MNRSLLHLLHWQVFFLFVLFCFFTTSASWEAHSLLYWTIKLLFSMEECPFFVFQTIFCYKHSCETNLGEGPSFLLLVRNVEMWGPWKEFFNRYSSKHLRLRNFTEKVVFWILRCLISCLQPSCIAKPSNMLAAFSPYQWTSSWPIFHQLIMESLM